MAATAPGLGFLKWNSGSVEQPQSVAAELMLISAFLRLGVLRLLCRSPSGFLEPWVVMTLDKALLGCTRSTSLETRCETVLQIRGALQSGCINLISLQSI